MSTKLEKEIRAAREQRKIKRKKRAGRWKSQQHKNKLKENVNKVNGAGRKMNAIKMREDIGMVKSWTSTMRYNMKGKIGTSVTTDTTTIMMESAKVKPSSFHVTLPSMCTLHSSMLRLQPTTETTTKLRCSPRRSVLSRLRENQRLDFGTFRDALRE